MRLQSFHTQTRQTVLAYLASDSFLIGLQDYPDILAAITTHIIEICNNWEWL